MNGASEDILLEDEIERDEQDTEGGQKDALPLSEVIAGQDNGKEEEVKKREPVADEEGDGQNPEEDRAEDEPLRVPLDKRLELSDGYSALLRNFYHQIN